MARIKKNKEAIRLRTKKLSNGNLSLYLDYYKDGIREYEFLKLYLVPERTPADKIQNEGTLRTANLIKASRIVSTQNEEHGFKDDSKGNVNFLEFMQSQADEYFEKGSVAYSESVKATIEHLKAYKGDKIQLKKVNRAYLKGFVEYLNKVQSRRNKPLSEASKALYYDVVSIALNKAVKNEYISMNPAVKIGGDERPQQGEATKQYLTFDEVKAMVDTPCKNEMIKKAFLFSCFCGLRYSDVKNLTWKKIQEVATGTYQVEITQQKTGETLYLPLSDNALTWLPERLDAKDDDVVFNLPSSPTTIEKHLGLWAEEAGVKKHVTFHVSRHTNATLMLYFGADIYMVSKLLGHNNVRTTQVYAKIVDESKRKAVNLIPSINLK
jgi:integrase